MTTENVTHTPLKLLAATCREERECREREGGAEGFHPPTLKNLPKYCSVGQ